MKQRIILGLGITLLAVLLTSNYLDKYSQDRARVLRFSGTVSIERLGKKIPTVVGVFLNAQDKIVTGPDAFVEVAYDDAYRDVMRLGPRTSVVLQSVVIEKQTSVYMDQGEAVFKLQDLVMGSTFRVETPIAIVGVRGTSFGVKLVGNQAVIADYESRIFVKGLNEDLVEMKDELLLSEGWKVRVAQFERPSRVEMITDLEYAAWRVWLDDIAALTKESIDAHGFSAKFRFLEDILFKLHLSCLTYGFTANPTAAAPFLVFLLYMALAANLGKVFLRRL